MRNGITSYAELGPGSYPLIVSAPGFGEVRRTIEIESGSQRQVSLTLRDAQIDGTVGEVAAEPSPPAGELVRLTPVAGQPLEVPVARDGSFAADHVPVGKVTLEVVAFVPSNTRAKLKRYDDEPTTVNLHPGENAVRLAVPLSAAESYVRWNLLLEDGRRPNLLRAGKKYHHPDAMRYGCAPAEYARDLARRQIRAC